MSGERGESGGRSEGGPGQQVPARLLAMAGLALAVVGLLHLYLWRTLVLEPGLTGLPRVLGGALLGVGFALFPATFWVQRRPRGAFRETLLTVGFVWMGAFQLLLGFALLADLLFFAYRRFVGVVSEGEARWLAQLEAGLVASLSLMALLWGIKVARGPARLERVRVAIPELPEGLLGLRIAQVSDLHVGDTLDGRWLQGVVDRVNALGADLIAVTGDLVDGPVRTLRDEVRPLAGLKAPLGVYFVTGNHEYYAGGPEWVAEVSRLGLTSLLNEHRVVRRGGASLVVAGVPDLEGARFHPHHACRPDLAFAGAPLGAPRLLLAHQPKVARLAKGLGVSLQLSGHTHAGQLWPFTLLVPLQQPTVRGLETVEGVLVYTHRGTGYWGPPVRFGTTSEIALLTLERA